jgi:hypothetical protein
MSRTGQSTRPASRLSVPTRFDYGTRRTEWATRPSWISPDTCSSRRSSTTATLDAGEARSPGSIVKTALPSRQETITTPQPQCDPLREDKQKVEGVSLQSGETCKSLKRIGSSGRIRTYNPSVNSRVGTRFCSAFNALQVPLYQHLATPLECER